MMVCGMPKHVAYIVKKQKVPIYQYIKLCWTVSVSLIIKPHDYARYQLALNHTVSVLVCSLSHADLCRLVLRSSFCVYDILSLNCLRLLSVYIESKRNSVSYLSHLLTIPGVRKCNLLI